MLHSFIQSFTHSFFQQIFIKYPLWDGAFEPWCWRHHIKRIDVFDLWCWRRLLRVPWTARRSNQSILREINSEYSFEGLMLKLTLQYFGHLMWATDCLEKPLILGKIEGRRRREWQRIRQLDGITDVMNMNLGKFWEMVRDREACHAAARGVTESDTTGWLNNSMRWWRTGKPGHGVAKNWTRLSDWTITTMYQVLFRGWGFSSAQDRPPSWPVGSNLHSSEWI